MSSSQSFTVLLNYSCHHTYFWWQGEVLLLLPIASLCVLPPRCLFDSSFVILTLIALPSSLGDIIFHFLIFRLSWTSISGRDFLFQKLSIFGHLLHFSHLYLGSPCIFVSITVLHFSFSFSFLQLYSFGLCSSSKCWFPWNTNLCISLPPLYFHFTFALSSFKSSWFKFL